MAQNWAGNVTFGDARSFSPTSVEELQAIVRDNRRVKVRGVAKSFSRIADTTEASVLLDEMPRELLIDKERQVVTVNSRMMYGPLSEALHAEGWALHNLASLPHISVAGAIATATHGSGVANGNLSSAVRGLHVVAADGSLRVVRPEDGDDFYGSVVGLGLCGVVVRVELAIQPTFVVAQAVYAGIPREALRRDFDAVMGAAYSVSYFTRWGPDGLGDVWAKHREPAKPPASLCGVAAATADRHPCTEDYEACTPQCGVPGPWHRRLPHFRMEHAPSSKGDELQSEFFLDRKDAVAALAKLEGIAPELHPFMWVSELRTMAADGLWMSGAYGRPTVSVHFTWKQVDEAYDCIKKVQACLAPFDYRPHFGKIHFTSAEHLARVFPLARFRELVARLDPLGKFGNEECARMLGVRSCL